MATIILNPTDVQVHPQVMDKQTGSLDTLNVQPKSRVTVPDNFELTEEWVRANPQCKVAEV